MDAQTQTRRRTYAEVARGVGNTQVDPIQEESENVEDGELWQIPFTAIENAPTPSSSPEPSNVEDFEEIEEARLEYETECNTMTNAERPSKRGDDSPNIASPEDERNDPPSSPLDVRYSPIPTAQPRRSSFKDPRRGSSEGKGVQFMDGKVFDDNAGEGPSQRRPRSPIPSLYESSSSDDDRPALHPSNGESCGYIPPTTDRLRRPGYLGKRPITRRRGTRKNQPSWMQRPIWMQRLIRLCFQPSSGKNSRPIRSICSPFFYAGLLLRALRGFVGLVRFVVHRVLYYFVILIILWALAGMIAIGLLTEYLQTLTGAPGLDSLYYSPATARYTCPPVSPVPCEDDYEQSQQPAAGYQDAEQDATSWIPSRILRLIGRFSPSLWSTTQNIRRTRLASASDDDAHLSEDEWDSPTPQRRLERARQSYLAEMRAGRSEDLLEGGSYGTFAPSARNGESSNGHSNGNPAPGEEREDDASSEGDGQAQQWADTMDDDGPMPKVLRDPSPPPPPPPGGICYSLDYSSFRSRTQSLPEMRMPPAAGPSFCRPHSTAVEMQSLSPDQLKPSSAEFEDDVTPGSPTPVRMRDSASTHTLRSGTASEGGSQLLSPDGPVSVFSTDSSVPARGRFSCSPEAICCVPFNISPLKLTKTRLPSNPARSQGQGSAIRRGTSDGSNVLAESNRNSSTNKGRWTWSIRRMWKAWRDSVDEMGEELSPDPSTPISTPAITPEGSPSPPPERTTDPSKWASCDDPRAVDSGYRRPSKPKPMSAVFRLSDSPHTEDGGPIIRSLQPGVQGIGFRNSTITVTPPDPAIAQDLIKKRPITGRARTCENDIEDIPSFELDKADGVAPDTPTKTRRRRKKKSANPSSSRSISAGPAIDHGYSSPDEETPKANSSNGVSSTPGQSSSRGKQKENEAPRTDSSATGAQNDGPYVRDALSRIIDLSASVPEEPDPLIFLHSGPVSLVQRLTSPPAGLCDNFPKSAISADTPSDLWVRDGNVGEDSALQSPDVEQCEKPSSATTMLHEDAAETSQVSANDASESVDVGLYREIDGLRDNVTYSHHEFDRKLRYRFCRPIERPRASPSQRKTLRLEERAWSEQLLKLSLASIKLQSMWKDRLALMQRNEHGMDLILNQTKNNPNAADLRAAMADEERKTFAEAAAPVKPLTQVDSAIIECTQYWDESSGERRDSATPTLIPQQKTLGRNAEQDYNSSSDTGVTANTIAASNGNLPTSFTNQHDSGSISTSASLRARMRFELNSAAQSWQPVYSKSTASVGVHAGQSALGHLSIRDAVSPLRQYGRSVFVRDTTARESPSSTVSTDHDPFTEYALPATTKASPSVRAADPDVTYSDGLEDAGRYIFSSTPRQKNDAASSEDMIEDSRTWN